MCVEKQASELEADGFARTCRILLRGRSAEFGQSVHSVSVDGFICPNRDYAYEGLCAEVGTENWKLLDALPFALRDSKGNSVVLSPLRVKVFPWKAQYFYSAPQGELCVEYLLFSLGRCSLGVCFEPDSALANALGAGASIVIRPLVDLRHMYASSSAGAHSCIAKDGALEVSKDGCRLLLSGSKVRRVSPSFGERHWFYKLGSGNRERCADGFARFVGESRLLREAAEVELGFSGGRAVLWVSVSAGNRRKRSCGVELPFEWERLELLRLSRYSKPFQPAFEEAQSKWGKATAVALSGRLLCLLDKFEWNGFPDAGAFWFRNAWFRDAFEGLNVNFDLYYTCRKRALSNMVFNALSLEKNGLVPNKTAEKNGEAPSFNSLDATLLVYLAVIKLLRKKRDRVLLKQLRDSARSTIASFAGGKAGILLDERGLLKCPANFGWMDSMRSVDAGGSAAVFPSRVPKECVSNAFAEFGGNAAKISVALNSPSFYLVECNALWLAFLKELLDFASDDDLTEVQEIVDRVESNFKDFFMMGNGLLSQCVSYGGVKAAEESSASLVSMALLPSVFSNSEVNLALETASNTLFVRNKGRLFGLLCRNYGERVFTGDAEYHGAVVWPRDSPYLLALLRRLGREKEAEELIISALDHQQSEAAVFFNSELLSPDFGTALVPVKNPCQYWSQWTQPMLEFLNYRQTTNK